MIRDNALFNLLAMLGKMLIASEPESVDVLDAESEEKIIGQVRDALAQWRPDLEGSAAKGFSSHKYNSILRWCRAHGNFYLLRAMICELDAARWIGWEQLWPDEQYRSFRSLNSNKGQTRLLVFPKFPGPKTTYLREERSEQGVEEKVATRKTAYMWADNLYERLNHFYFVQVEALQGFSVTNYICDVVLGSAQKNAIRIGASPVWNKKYEEYLSFREFTIENKTDGLSSAFFDSVKNGAPAETQVHIKKSLKSAGRQEADIAVWPEMLGTPELYKLDGYGFNPKFRAWIKEMGRDAVPQLLLAPSLWEDCSNRVNVYSQSGRHICTQYKQNPYCLPGKRGRCTERLKAGLKEICLLHVPGWGRIAIPICVDYLQPDYADLLVTVLKADFLICPSFSPGEYDFFKSMGTYMRYGTFVVWLNSCSALRAAASGDPIGAACTPSVSSGSPVIRFAPECSGSGCEGCLFLAELPLDCRGDGHLEDAVGDCRHIPPEMDSS